MTEPIHYIEPTSIAFKYIVVYNKAGLIMVELHDEAGSIVHSYHSPGTFDADSKLKLSLGGTVRTTRES